MRNLLMIAIVMLTVAGCTIEPYYPHDYPDHYYHHGYWDHR